MRTVVCCLWNNKDQPSMNKLITRNLSKTYPNGVKALDNISIEIENGMFGLLAPNGAGNPLMQEVGM